MTPSTRCPGSRHVLRARTPTATSSSRPRADGAPVPGADQGGHSPALLSELLVDARGQGFLGPGPLEPQIQHARGFKAIGQRLSPVGSPRVIDLGSGGGLPGLVVATEWPDVTLDLLEANGRRAAFLRRAVERLGLESRV